jgi:hypothetical protein
MKGWRLTSTKNISGMVWAVYKYVDGVSTLSTRLLKRDYIRSSEFKEECRLRRVSLVLRN